MTSVDATTVRVTTPAPRATWQELMAGGASVTPSQTPVWLDAVCAHGPWEDASRLYETHDGRALVLPLVRSRHRPISVASQHSMPSTWGTGGILAAEPVRAGDVTAVVADLSASRSLTVTVRPDFEQARLWADPARAAGARCSPAVHHVLDLGGDFDQLRSGFSKMARKAIRKAEREGVVVQACRDRAAVLEFYRLYERWIDHRARQRGIPLSVARRKGRANEPLARLLTLSESLGQSLTVWTALRGGEAVAAMITLVQGDIALAWRAASDREAAGPVRANDLLHRHAIEAAASRGCRYYNMGESGGVASLMRYKARFGATPRQLATFRFERLPVSAVTGPATVLRQRAESAAIELAGRLRPGRVLDD